MRQCNALRLIRLYLHRVRFLSPLRLPISPLRQLVIREEVTQIQGGWQGGMRVGCSI
jgi:hypothetical protein